MTEHAFRVYVVEVFKNRKKDNKPEVVASGSPMAVEITNLLEDLHSRRTVFFKPRPPAADSDEPAKRVKSATVGDPVVVRPDLIHVELSEGEVGERPVARHPEKDPQDLEDFSAEQPYFMTVMFPSDEDGERFIIVAQVKKRTDAVDVFERLLRSQSVLNRRAAEESEKAERRRLREEHQPRPARLEHHSLLFTRQQAVDNAYLDYLIETSNSATAEFTTKVPSPRNADQEVVQRKLRISLLDERGREIPNVVGREWTRGLRRGEPVPRSAGVAQLADLLSDQDLMDESEASEYTEASVVLTGRAGTTTIAVDMLRDVFTYPVTEGPPSVHQHYTKVAPRVQIIAAEEGVELALIDPVEISRCVGE